MCPHSFKMLLNLCIKETLQLTAQWYIFEKAKESLVLDQKE